MEDERFGGRHWAREEQSGQWSPAVWKFDICYAAAAAKAVTLRRQWAPRTVRSGLPPQHPRWREESIVIAAHRALLPSIPEFITRFEPRHPEQAPMLSILCVRQG